MSCQGFRHDQRPIENWCLDWVDVIQGDCPIPGDLRFRYRGKKYNPVVFLNQVYIASERGFQMNTTEPQTLSFMIAEFLNRTLPKLTLESLVRGDLNDEVPFKWARSCWWLEENFLLSSCLQFWKVERNSRIPMVDEDARCILQLVPLCLCIKLDSASADSWIFVSVPGYNLLPPFNAKQNLNYWKSRSEYTWGLLNLD